MLGILALAQAFGPSGMGMYHMGEPRGSQNEYNINKRLRALGLDSKIEEDYAQLLADYQVHADKQKKGASVFIIRGFYVWGFNRKGAEKKLIKMLKDNGFYPYITLDELAEKLDNLEKLKQGSVTNE